MASWVEDKDWHRFRLDDLRLLLDVGSGSLHMIDEITWDILDYYDPCDRGEGETEREAVIEALQGRYPVEQIRDALAELNQLRADGLIAAGDPLGNAYRPAGDAIVKALCLIITEACNLRCRYCFAGRGEQSQASMSEAVAKRSIDFLLENSGNRRHCEVDFFGGEPLLNFKTVKAAVEYGRRQASKCGKELKFTLTTNCVLLNDEVADFLREHGISVVLSLDGRREINDNMRFFPGGRGTYDIILPRIKGLLASINGLDYWVRGTYTRENLDFASDVMHLVDIGFQRISVEPVVAAETAETEAFSLRGEDLPAIEAEYDRLARLYLELKRQGRGFSFFHFNVDLDGGPCIYKRLIGCGAGNEYLAVSPAGELYPCHQFVGRGKYLIGDVFSGIRDQNIRRTFKNAHIYNKPECSSCWARFYCGGGCHANADQFHGDIFHPYEVGCALMKKRLECALLVQAASTLDQIGAMSEQQ
ncbi:MAG: thioether cross-link-forming SCIFF peptide maturase [Firmicutes bacterium]|nr:thioether cross-link-forming SCIFF peptide maturase [Bacillota bacterium]